MSATLPRSMRAFPVSRPGPKDLQWVLRCSVGLGPGADAAGSASAAQWVCEGDGVGCQEPAAGSEHLGSRDGLAYFRRKLWVWWRCLVDPRLKLKLDRSLSCIGTADPVLFLWSPQQVEALPCAFPGARLRWRPDGRSTAAGKAFSTRRLSWVPTCLSRVVGGRSAPRPAVTRPRPLLYMPRRGTGHNGKCVRG